MKTGKYTLREFFSDRDLNTIIVPEIQRDYVWGKEQIERFLDSIIEDFVAFKKFTPITEIVNVISEIVHSYNEFYRKNYLSSNIGFIYAYSDPDYPGSYFLIDGQQRFTTIFLTLLVLAANGDDEQRKKFNRVFLNDKNDKKPKLDYRVREASHLFLSKLVQTIEQARNEFSSKWIKEQSWYLQDYDNDATISSIINNIDVVNAFLKDKHKDEQIITDVSSVDEVFVEYVEDYLEFWYFDTNISEQGEELYIYMNARGESMQEHENLKADLIGKLTDPDKKMEYGKKWEIWQDLFWRNKGNNVNADNGFNEFLCCIAGLENYWKRKNEVSEAKDFVIDGAVIPYENKKELLSMEIIEQYWEGLDELFLEKNINDFSRGYSYSGWIEKAKREIWNIFNDNKTNWFAKYSDDNRATERNRMVYVWSMLYYMKSLKDKNKSLDLDNNYRTFRLFYVRYKNYDRAVETSIENVTKILDQGPWCVDVLNEEETNKYGFLKQKATKEFEEWIWRIEDHPLNLNGSGVGGINCSHLVDFDKNPTVNELEIIYDSFCNIFPINGDKYNIAHPYKLLNALLFTSVLNCDAKPFWDKWDRWCYERLYFNTERRYIRGLSTYGKGNNVFKSFFTQFINSGGNYMDKTNNDIKAAMLSKGVAKEEVDTSNIIWALAWYAAAKGTSIWDEGKCLIYNFSDKERKKDLSEKDSNFESIKTLVNCGGTIHRYKRLSDLVDR